MMNKMMKKVAVLMAAASMALASMTCIASANDGMGIDTMKNVTVQALSPVYKYANAQVGVNVRTKPSTEGQIIRALDYNESVRVEGMTSNGWYQVIVSRQDGGTSTGYVSANLLSDTKGAAVKDNASYGYASGIKDGEFVTNNAGTPDYVETAANQATKEQYTVSVDGYLALRTEPAFNYDNEFAQLHTGDVVNFKENYGTYWCVYVPATGQLGFVNSNYLV